MTASISELPHQRRPGSLSEQAVARLSDAAAALARMPAELARSIDVVGIAEPPVLVRAVATGIAAAHGLRAELSDTDPAVVRFARFSPDRIGTARR